MFTYQIKIEYLGTKFVGWQFQKNGLSIQEVLEKTLSNFLKHKVSVIGSGRTDAGVHASGQSAHFKTGKKIINKDKFVASINFFLRKYPIVILILKKKTNKFHARYSANKRVYKYFIINRRSSLVLEKNKAWHIKNKLDLKIMKKGSAIVDVAIDQGGCFETSKPTTHENPIYELEGIMHYCVANMPGAVARTSTIALGNVTMPFILSLLNKGWKNACKDDQHLLNGLNVHAGHLTCKPVGIALNIKTIDPDSALTI